ncbi:MAG: SPFH domain-containing protein [Defluviitaleaceae bacterium]|nr:SPFH domain-containing protein [Defluviitaleaceae bacterium]MCL2274296.1 SPFH domain-containing protein [Defluviitaleaceae bacterium]
MNDKTMNASVAEKGVWHIAGMPVLIINTLLTLGAIAAIVLSFFYGAEGSVHVPMLVGGIVYLALPMWLLYGGLCILRPQEAYVLTLFGKYAGTLRGPGFFFVNPFTSAFKSDVGQPSTGSANIASTKTKTTSDEISAAFAEEAKKKISLKTKTLNNDKQRINDLLGNPVIIDTVVVWRIVDTAKAMFNVDNFIEFLSIQCDSSLRAIVSQYPYDVPRDGQGEDKCLRSASDEIVTRLVADIQTKVNIAGMEIMDARITNLSYAPEIASAMLQRQQASAVVDAKQTIVDGAVDIVKMALKRLSEDSVVELDEERKAAMVSNLLVVLCSNSEAQPVINSGSLY